MRKPVDKEKESARKKLWYEKNKVRLKQKTKEYYRTEAGKKIKKNYYEKNRERMIQESKEWVNNNKDHFKELQKKYYEKNKEKLKEKRLSKKESQNGNTN